MERKQLPIMAGTAHVEPSDTDILAAMVADGVPKERYEVEMPTYTKQFIDDAVGKLFRESVGARTLEYSKQYTAHGKQAAVKAEHNASEKGKRENAAHRTIETLQIYRAGHPKTSNCDMQHVVSGMHRHVRA